MDDSLKIISKIEQLALNSQIDVKIRNENGGAFVAGLERIEDPLNGEVYQLWGYNDRLGNGNPDFDLKSLIKRGTRELKIKPFMVLDLGCGVGNFLKQVYEIKHVEVFGIDRHLMTRYDEFQIPMERMIVGDYAHLDGVVGKTQVPYILYKIPDNSFHLVVSSRSNRFESKLYPQFFNQIYRILAPNGFASIEVLNPAPTKSDRDEFRKKVDYFEMFESRIDPNGAAVIEIGKY